MNRITNLPSKWPSRATVEELRRYAEVALSHDIAFGMVYDAVLWKRELVDHWWTDQSHRSTEFLARFLRNLRKTGQ